MESKALLNEIRTIVREETRIVVKEEIAPLETRMDRLETKVDRLKTKVDRVETKVDRLETKVDGLETKVDGLETKGDNLQAQVNSLERILQVVRDSQLNVELVQLPRIVAVRDEVVGSNQKNEEQDDRIFVLENKAENHGNRIAALEYLRKAE